MARFFKRHGLGKHLARNILGMPKKTKKYWENNSSDEEDNYNFEAERQTVEYKQGCYKHDPDAVLDLSQRNDDDQRSTGTWASSILNKIHDRVKKFKNKKMKYLLKTMSP